MTACRQPGLSRLTAALRTLWAMLVMWCSPSMSSPWRPPRPPRALAAACLATALAAPAAAQTAPARVGHASVLAGAVQHSVDGQAWGPAAVGWPLTTRSALRTPAQSRAEVAIGSTVLRLSAQAELHFDQLDDDAMVLRLDSGRLNLRQRRWGAPGDRLSVDLAGARFDATSAGHFHLDVDPRAQRVAARVFEGSGTLTLAGRRLALASGQQVLADLRNASVLQQGPAERSALDEWSDRRDLRSSLRSEAADARGEGSAEDHAPPEMTGAGLLDAHGAWRVLPRLGAVWFPRSVPPDWAPYRQGRWAWLAPWGWTWVDDAAWGFAPFHYGRWTFVAGRWGWLPGDRRARVVFAPALVGFYGTPPGGWAAGHPDAVGWYPLGPGEAYPATQPQSHRLAQTSFAATVVPRAAFVGGLPVAAARLDVAPGTLAGAPVLGLAGQPPGPGSANAPAPMPAVATPTPPPPQAGSLRERLREARQARRAAREAGANPSPSTP